MPTPQSDAGCAGIARARRRGHPAKSARPWRCAAARGGAILRYALGGRRTEVYLSDMASEEKRVSKQASKYIYLVNIFLYQYSTSTVLVGHIGAQRETRAGRDGDGRMSGRAGHASELLRKVLAVRKLTDKRCLPGMADSNHHKQQEWLQKFYANEPSTLKTFERLCIEHLGDEDRADIAAKVAEQERKTAEAPPDVDPGSRVKLSGLEARPELNGATGVVVGDKQRGRVPVRLDTTDWKRPPMLFKVTNVTLEAEPDTTDQRSLAGCKEAYRARFEDRQPHCWGMIDSCLEARRSCGPSQPRPLLGRRVLLHGLQARPELNGACGRAISYEEAKERFAVILLGRSGHETAPLLLRAANLEAVSQEDETTSASSAELRKVLPHDLAEHVSKMERRLPPELGRAAFEGRRREVQSWLAKGNNSVNARVHKPGTGEDGVTLLSAAVEGGHERLVRLLIDRGADVNLPDKQGGSPLMIAAEEGNWPAVEDLLLAGADAAYSTTKSGHGLVTALGLAQERLISFRPLGSRLSEIEPMGVDKDIMAESAGKCAYDHGAVVTLLRWQAIAPIGGSRRPAGINEAMRDQEHAVMNMGHLRSGTLDGCMHDMVRDIAVTYGLGSHQSAEQRQRDARLNEWMTKGRNAHSECMLPWQDWAKMM